jgi:mono/diheme cytochrome c family protein
VRPGGWRGIGALAAVALAAAACGSARRDEPAAPRVAMTSEEARAGERVFMRACNSCHPGGQGGLGPAINDKPLPAALIKTQVRAGLGKMPAFSKEKVTDAELDSLVAYLEALRSAPGPVE